MPRLTPEEVDTFLAEPGHLIRIATVDADGMPRVVPLWFERVGDDLLFTPRSPAVLTANLQRDPRIGVSIDEEATPYRKVTVQGRAELAFAAGADDAWRDRYRSIASRYIPRTNADAYVDGTADQPRPLYRLSLRSPSVVTSWRMPVRGEDPNGIWAGRYYVPGTR